MNASDQTVAGAEGYRPPARPYGMSRFAIAAGVLVAAFSPALYQLFQLSLENSLYSHIPLIPAVSVFLVWIDRQRLPHVARPDFARAGLFGLGGLGLLAGYWLCVQNGVALTEDDFLSFTISAFVLSLSAVGSVFLGRPMVTAMAFPLAFLVFMVPFPSGMEVAIETFLQYGSAWVAYLFFKVTGMPVFMDNLYFQLPGFNMHVAPECSGIHSSLALLIVSLVAGQLFLRSNWRRSALAVFVIPLALLRNGFRIFVIGQLCVRISPEMIDSYIHRQGGPIFFALSMIPFSFVLFYLYRAERKARATA